MKMNSNIYKNEIIDDDERQGFRRIPIDWFNKTQPSIKPKLYEQTVTETTTTTINKETNSTTDEMTTTHLEKSPIRRVNLVHGPQSAFARLFPDKYRQEQEEFVKKQRPKSLYDQQYYNLDRLKTSDDLDYEDIRKSHRISFSDQPNNQYLSDAIHSNTQTKSDPYLSGDVANIPLNYDPDPEIIYRDNPNKVVYVQKVGVRYLKPPTPPPPEPIIIRERHATPTQQPPPMIISTTPPATPRTPSPLIVREQPPTPPPHQPTKIITKTLPAPPASSRRVIIKRVPPLPAKPRPVIIEKWLPYKTPAERPILYERAQQSEQNRSQQRNVILQYEPAHVRIEQEIQNAGYFRVDPEVYRAQFGSQLRRTDSIRRVLQDIGCNPDLITSTGYNTTHSSSNQTNNNSSHYDYPRKTTTCFTDEQLSELIDTPTPSQTKNQVYYTTIVSNS